MERFGVEAGGAGQRLDRWLAQQLQELSRSRVAGWIRDGRVTLDGQAVKPSTLVSEGDVVQVQLPSPRPSSLEPEDLGLALLYEDQHLAIVDKPAGITVHPDLHHHHGTLVHGLLFALQGRLSGVGDVERPGIVHRLDKGTSGALVVAKTDQAHAGLSALFATHDIERVYLALVRGVPSPSVLDAPIERHPRDRKRFTSRSGGGKKARTHIEAVRGFPPPWTEVSRVQCSLETGRTHQVRVHLSDAGHPIIGDVIYGPKRGLAWVGSSRLRAVLETAGRPMLHARVLGFVHPVTGESIRVKSPLPKDMDDILGALGGA